MTFNGEAVTGSPFTCQVVDTTNIALSGEGLRAVPSNVPASFYVDPKGGRDFELQVRVVCKFGFHCVGIELCV